MKFRIRNMYLSLIKTEWQNPEILKYYELPDLYVVGSGISKGDQILLEGVQKVKDDQKVKTKFQDPKKFFRH
jgi:hypothetical protein